jgi:hypothetical protein
MSALREADCRIVGRAEPLITWRRPMSEPHDLDRSEGPGVERQRPLERRCSSAPRPPAQNGDPTRKAGSTKDGGKPTGARDALNGKAETPALKPYWGKPAVRNFREGSTRHINRTSGVLVR